MAIISANLQFNRGGHGLLDYSSLQANYSAALAWAKDVNSNAAVGQFIYLEAAETISGVEYAKGPYVVDAIGENAVLTPLSKSVAGEQDLSGAVTDLKGDVADIKTDVAAKVDASVYNEKMQEVATSISTIDSSIATLEQGVADVSAKFADYATKQELEDAIGDIDFSTLATKEEVNNSLALKADASNVYTKGEVYTKDEVDQAISDVVDQIPAAPFQSVASNDKLLVLTDGVLESHISYGREEVDGVDSIVLKGVDGTVIGSVPVADFIADGMLDSVAPKADNPNIFVFTFNSAAGSKSFEVDFSKYVDTYFADNATIELKSVDGKNVFAVKDGVFEAAGAAADVKAEIETALASYALAENVYSKTDADSTFVKAEGYVAYSQEEKDKLAGIADNAQVNVLEGVQVNGADLAISDKKVNIDLSAYALSSNVDASLNGKVDKVDGERLMTVAEGAKLASLAEIKSVAGDLALNDGELSVNLSTYAKSDDVAANYVAKDGNKVLSTNDFTNEFKTKLEGIAAGAEVNVVKSVDTNGVLRLSGDGALSSDMSAYATSESMNSALANKLDLTATVNGQSFVDGAATIDAGDISLEAAITRGENAEEVYGKSLSIQSVLASLSQRIDVLDPNVSGELGITNIIAGNGIVANIAGGGATISVKASANDGNVATVETDGIFVPDMRSYWMAI